jgi:crotonobetainyl-CoA:carnitine CoA-transferase CaiB-like acyl-CoA transferase
MLPLADIRVLDFTWAMAGPQATRLLADFGADVVKVESSEHLDLARTAFGPHPHGPDAFGPDSSGYFNHFNRNKRSITLNLKHPGALAVALDLVRASDVVIENFSAGVLEGFGLSFERMREARPDVIYVSMAGPGHRGPYRDHRTFGPTVQALSGLTHLSGFPDREPAGWGFSYMDHSAGYAAATAVLMALYRRDRTGDGERVDLSQIEAAIALTGPAVLDSQVNRRPSGRIGNTDPGAHPHGIYRCADEDGLDRWIAIACYTDAQRAALASIVGLDEIEQWTRPQLAHDVMRTLQAAGVPAGVVQNNQDLAERDDQLAHRGLYPKVMHARLGTYQTDGLPVVLSQTPGGVRTGAPLLGEHTDDVLRSVLGYDDERIARLRDAGALR